MPDLRWNRLVMTFLLFLSATGFAGGQDLSVDTVLIPGGWFDMGDAQGAGNERPVHRVHLSPFRMAKTEVTVGQFRAFVQATGYLTTAELTYSAMVVNLLAKELTPIFEYRVDASWRNPYYAQDEGFPVTLVSHSDAQHYCNWLSQQQGLGPVYQFGPEETLCDPTASGWRLPTEAEWERAARLSWSGEAIRQERLAARGNHGRPVSSLATTGDPGALVFLLGNVNEWCEDWYGAYEPGDQADPTGPKDGAARVLRGGSWYKDFWYTEILQPTRRWWAGEDPVSNDIGFRVVKNNAQ